MGADPVCSGSGLRRTSRTTSTGRRPRPGHARTPCSGSTTTASPATLQGGAWTVSRSLKAWPPPPPAMDENGRPAPKSGKIPPDAHARSWRRTPGSSRLGTKCRTTQDASSSRPPRSRSSSTKCRRTTWRWTHGRQKSHRQRPALGCRLLLLMLVFATFNTSSEATPTPEPLMGRIRQDVLKEISLLVDERSELTSRARLARPRRRPLQQPYHDGQTPVVQPGIRQEQNVPTRNHASLQRHARGTHD